MVTEATLTKFLGEVVLGAAWTASAAIAPAPLLARDDHRKERQSHDSNHNGDHQWNNREDRAYRIWAKENHRRYRQFSRLNERGQQAYWNWRHDHSDALLRNDNR